MNSNRIKKFIPFSGMMLREENSADANIVDAQTDESFDFREALKSDSWTARLNAVKTFRARGQISDAEITALVSLMNNHFERPIIRVAAAESLGLKGYGAKYAFPFLCKMVHDDEIWREAIQALRTIGVGNAVVISALIRVLSDPSKRPEAAMTLGAYGTSARASVPALQAVLGYSGSYTREIVEDAIRKIKGILPRTPRSGGVVTYR